MNLREIRGVKLWWLLTGLLGIPMLLLIGMAMVALDVKEPNGPHSIAHAVVAFIVVPVGFVSCAIRVLSAFEKEEEESQYSTSANPDTPASGATK